MNSKIKKIIIGLVALATALWLIPLDSIGKASDHNRIVLTADNTVNLNGVIDDQSVAATIQALQKLIQDINQISLFICICIHPEARSRQDWN